MSPTLQQRIDAFVQWRLSHPPATDDDESPQIHEQRRARERVLSEIPLLRERLSNAIGEVNDGVLDTGLHLKLVESSKVTLDASFRISLWPEDDDTRALEFNVAHDGQLVVLMALGNKVTRLKSVEIWAADRNFLLEALVSFLETTTTE